MNIVFLLILAIIPIALILFLTYKRDKNKEPLFLLIQLFILGILSSLLVMAISLGLEKILPFMNRSDPKNITFIGTILYSFVGVALVEEVCKWIMVNFRAYNINDFDEMYDIIIYAVFVSLGFAFFENILYVLKAQKVITALTRAISAIPGHAGYAIFMGYYLGLAKKQQAKGNKAKEKEYKILSIFMPTLLHGIYDYCVFSGLTILLLIFILFIIFLYIVSIKKLIETSAKGERIIETLEFCECCGARLTDKTCQRCGHEKE